MFVKISQNELSSNTFFEKLAQACQVGFFYLEIPQNLKSLIDHSVNFGNSFYKTDEYTNLTNLEGFSGYYDRKNFQVESLYLEKKYWEEKLSCELKNVAYEMQITSVDILKKVLTHCNVLQSEWNLVTGGATSFNCQTHLTYNHYRFEKNNDDIQGMHEHCDFGQITVLFINKPGLQVKFENEWHNVDPVENHFVINFGAALEKLINNPAKLVAASHRVLRVSNDRISFGIFTDNSNESMIYTMIDGNLISTGMTFQECAEKGFSAYY